MHVHPDSIQKRIGLRQRRTLCAVGQARPEIEAGSHHQLGDGDVAREYGGRGSACPSQFSVRHGTDTRRIAQTHVLSLHSQIEIELTVISSRVSSEADGAASDARGKSFDLQAVLIEYGGSVEGAHGTGQVAVRD